MHRATNPVTLYTQSGCAESPAVRDWLVGHGVPFVERNVTGDLDAATALYRTGTFATPLVVIGATRVLGFRPAEIEAALAGRGIKAGTT